VVGECSATQRPACSTRQAAAGRRCSAPESKDIGRSGSATVQRGTAQAKIQHVSIAAQAKRQRQAVHRVSSIRIAYAGKPSSAANGCSDEGDHSMAGWCPPRLSRRSWCSNSWVATAVTITTSCRRRARALRAATSPQAPSSPSAPAWPMLRARASAGADHGWVADELPRWSGRDAHSPPSRSGTRVTSPVGDRRRRGDGCLERIWIVALP